ARSGRATRRPGPARRLSGSNRARRRPPPQRRRRLSPPCSSEAEKVDTGSSPAKETASEAGETVRMKLWLAEQRMLCPYPNFERRDLRQIPVRDAPSVR